jgi:exonuclease VII small subunit
MEAPQTAVEIAEQQRVAIQAAEYHLETVAHAWARARESMAETELQLQAAVKRLFNARHRVQD